MAPIVPREPRSGRTTPLRRRFNGGRRSAAHIADLSDMRRHNATRHLCAAAYLDDDFRERAMREVYAQRRRWAAPSYGFDLVTVLRHVRMAWWLATTRVMILVGVVVITAWIAPLATAMAAIGMLIWWLVRLRLRMSVEFWRSLFRATAPDFYERLRHRRRWARNSLIFVGGVAFLGYSVGLSRLKTKAQAPMLVAQMGTCVLLLAIIVVVTMVAAFLRASLLSSLRHVGQGSIPKGRLRSLDIEQQHEVTVYSGPFPFVGSGYQLATWSFAQRLVRAASKADDFEWVVGANSKRREGLPGPRAPVDQKPSVNGNIREPEATREFDEPPFKAAELIKYLEDQLRELRDEKDEELRLPGLKVRHRVFVPGIESEWIPEHDDRFIVARSISNPSLPLRHHLACEISSWGGEIYTIVFIHVSLQGRSLYTEFSTSVLPPTLAKYHVFDESGKVGFAHSLTEAVRASWRLPESVVGIFRDLWRLGRYIGAFFAGLPSRSSAIRRGLDIGAQLSVRELGADLHTHDWFQFRDTYKHWKIIERRLLASMLDFLEDRNVDVAEYRQRSIEILNRGVINMGSGSVDVSGVIGDRSSVQVTTGGPP